MSTASGLQYDEQGFLIGVKRMGRDIGKIDANVEAILKILEQSRTTLNNSQQSQQQPLSPYQRALQAANQPFIDLESAIRQNTAALNRPAMQQNPIDADDLLNQAQQQRAADNPNAAPVRRNRPIPREEDIVDVGSTEDAERAFSRDRDASGRFSGDGEGGKSSIGKMADAVGLAVHGAMTDTRGVDPTVDAINELGTILTPMKKAAGWALRPLTGLMKARKRSEPLPREQESHNRKQLKILQRIADSRVGGGLSTVLRLIPLALTALAGIGGVLAAGFTAAAPIIAAAVGAAVAAYLLAKGKEKLDKLADENRPTEQGDINPDGSSNKGVVGYLNRKTKAIMNSGRGALNSVNGVLGGDKNYFDDGKAPDSKNRMGLKTDAINQDGTMLLRKKYGGQGLDAPEEDTGKALMTKPDREDQPISAKKSVLMKQAYDAAIKAGFSHEQAVATIGEIGRENDFNPKNIFGSHKDPSTGHNLGMISWQGARRKNLEKFMSSKGLLNKDGTIQQSQAGLEAQFEFLRDETKSKSKWREDFWDKKNISIDEARAAFGGKGSIIGWARGQTTIKQPDGSRIPFNSHKQEDKANKYSKEIESLVKAKVPRTPNALANFAQNAEMPKIEPPAIESMKKPATQNVWKAPKAVQQPVAKVQPIQSLPPKKVMQTAIQPVKEQLSSSGPQQVMVVNGSGGDNIGQNIGDRDLAHAVTGGIGMRNYNG